MSATAYVDGVDRSSNLVSSERMDEYCNPGARVTLVFDDEFPCNTWDPVVLYENGVKTFTGTVARIEQNRKETRVMTIIAKDDIRRLREYFVVEMNTTQGEGVKHWISYIASLAGCSVSYTTDYNPTELAYMTLGRMYAFEIIEELLLYAGWDIWCDANGSMRAGPRMARQGVEHAIAAGDNLSSFDRSEDSEPPRNAAMVYSVMGTVFVHRKFGWEIDNDDVRTMVVSSVYIDDIAKASDLANRMLSAAGPTYDIKRCILDAVDTDMDVGDRCTFDDGAGDTGTDQITTIISKMMGSGTVEEFHVSMGERCPKVGAGVAFTDIDGRDVIVATHESGVWRCKDIWASTIHWEPLNTGLQDHVYLGADDQGSSFKCEWFIRDPYKPNDLVFLLTQAGILYSASTEPGFEAWYPKFLNGSLAGNGKNLSGSAYKFTRIRSTIAREGAYFFTVLYYAAGGHRTFAGLTNDRFVTTHWGNWNRLPEDVWHESVTSNMYGPCNWNHQRFCTGPIPWHAPKGDAYFAESGAGGLAAWHKNDWGCTVTGIQSCYASNGGPAGWTVRRYGGGGTFRAYNGIEYNQDEVLKVNSIDYATTDCWGCYNTGGPLDPPCIWGSRPFNDKTFTYSAYASWLLCSTIHIPYNQKYSTDPDIIYYSPGKWLSAGAGGPHYAWPTRNGAVITLPWSPDRSLCHIKQGSIGTYTGDRTKVYAFSYGAPSRFATSEDEGLTWTEKSSVPFSTSCFSGFPTSKQKFYAGRDPVISPTTSLDTSLIYVSWDGGATFVDVTGDLWTQTQALQKRPIPTGQPGYPGYYGTAGLVTIAPRYS